MATVAKPTKKHRRPVEKPVEEKEHRDVPRVPRVGRNPGWVVCGFDTSLSCLAGCAIAYDRTLRKFKGPVFTVERWSTEHDYFSRIRRSAYAYELVLDLEHQLGVSMGHEDVYIAQEEPWPMGMAGGKNNFTSGYLKQQAEISGAFLGGLVRFGFGNVVQMNSMRWRSVIAKDLGITTHHTKWRDAALVKKYNCLPRDSGKFRSKQWALDSPPFSEKFTADVPDLPDIIERANGKIPRPEGSKARAVQPADEYDALAITWTFYLELEEHLNGKKSRA